MSVHEARARRLVHEPQDTRVVVASQAMSNRECQGCAPTQCNPMLAKAVGLPGWLSEEGVCSEPEQEWTPHVPFSSRRCSFNLFPCLDMQANQTFREKFSRANPLHVF